MDTAQTAGAPKHTRRTYLVDRGFQLKYTAILMVVGACITVLFGAMMYQAHVAATEMMGLPDRFHDVVAQRYDDRLLYLVAAITVVMTLSLALFGVLVTHRVAGPLHIIGRYVKSLGEGTFPALRPLRRRDELKAFFQAFQDAVEQIRARESNDLNALDEALAHLEGHCAKSPEAAASLGATLVTLKAIRDRKRAAIETPPGA